MPYDESVDIPNVVVDGSPNRSTVLTLTHWPGIPQPSGMGADLSAQMAFHYVSSPCAHAPANAVTNNHFDQDGLVSMHALVDPDESLRHEELLIDVAAAGDFATYRNRAAARASMALWSLAQPDRSPIADRIMGPYPQKCAALYEYALPLLIPMVTEPERFRELWVEEDEHLTASEKAIADGRITIEELPDVDLAVISVATDEPARVGHRFAGHEFAGVHPMAIHSATTCVRLLVVHGHRYQYVDRYETWVQYQSRKMLRRVELSPLAERLSDLEGGGVSWHSEAPGSLTPTLAHPGESTLSADTVRSLVVDHLRTAEPAWDPRTDIDPD